jgi:hypothetical protein
MGPYRPYRRFDVSAYKLFCPFFAAELGYSGKELVRERYEDGFNHDFDRYTGTAHFIDPFEVGLDVSVSADFYVSDGPNEDDHNLTWGVDLSWKPSDAVRFTAGSHFLKYRVVREPDQFTRFSEQYDVRVMSLGLDIRPTPCLRFGVRYMMESDEADGLWDQTFDTLEVRASFLF